MRTGDRCPECKGENISFDAGVCDWAICGGCGHEGEAHEFMSHREQAMRCGAADPKTGEAFTSAQRQAWIDEGRIVDVADTFPAEDWT